MLSQGNDMGATAAMVKRLRSERGATKASLPSFVSPQLATLVKVPPAGTQWLHELKFDGYRMLCRVHGKRIKFYSRNGLDWSSKFQNVVDALQKLDIRTALFDGEIVIVDARGRSSFQQLQRSMNRKTRSGFTYAIFDLLYLNGYDLRNVPLITRKELLGQVLQHAGGELRFSEHFQG